MREITSDFSSAVLCTAFRTVLLISRLVINSEKITTKQTYITLGKSLRSFTPIYDSHDKQIGVVAVGVPMKHVNEAFADGNKKILIGTVLGT